MTKRNNANSNNASRRSGRVTKTTEGTASVAPDGGNSEIVAEDGAVIEQPAEVVAELEQQGESLEVPAEAPAPEVEEVDEVTEVEEATDGMPAPDSEPSTEEAPAADPETVETPAEEAVPTAPVDLFADLPMVKVEDYEFRDLSGAILVSEPRKYEGVHKDAVAAKAHMKKGWKHSADMITLGSNRLEKKPGSVYGDLQRIVGSYGRAGVPAYVLVAKVRESQIGNKRSHYCTALPPIGWAEGWIDTFISKKLGKVMEKKAPVITAEVAQELQQIEQSTAAKLEDEQRKAA